MSRQISLTPTEQELRSILLDVADYIGSQHGYAKPDLRFTGGWVRDKLLGVASHDIDVGISSLTGEKFGVMMQQYFRDPETQSRHPERSIGTLSVIRENPDRSKHLETARTKICGIEVDLVNMRKETYTNDSRNPVVEFGTPEEDASRRDATVNAMFYNLSLDQIEDPTGKGLRDMGLKVIRTPMDPFQTFTDDPLRVLRCIRFASRLGYSIDADATRCMGHPAILQALRLKISRERIGEEISKMLKGPDPLQALSLINSLGLFDTIFTDPSQSQVCETDVSRWQGVCVIFSEIVTGDRPQLKTLRSLLLAKESDVYLGWLLASVVPLAGHPRLLDGNHPKSVLTGPAVTIREGLKLDNATTHVINDAFEHLDSILSTKNDFLRESTPLTLPQKRPFPAELDIREATGLAIRKWSRRKNSNWKLSVLFALLTEQLQAAGVDGPSADTGTLDGSPIHSGRHDILDGYVSWLLSIERMGLLDVHNLVPVLNGKEVMSAVGRKGGPWVNEALSDVVRWQLRHPNFESAEDARKMVVEKYTS